MAASNHPLGQTGVGHTDRKPMDASVSQDTLAGHQEVAMTTKRNRHRQSVSLPQRLQQAADAAREAAQLLPEGEARDKLLEKARQAETATRINQWLASPGLRSAPTMPSAHSASDSHAPDRDPAAKTSSAVPAYGDES
jgi:hypothetical protein